MAAYIARESFNTVDENGGTITVPIGARVEKGDHYYNAYPEAFEEETVTKFFGRVNPANGAIEPTAVLTTLAPQETPEETIEPVEETVEPEPVVAPEAVPSSAPKSSVGRRTLPRK